MSRLKIEFPAEAGFGAETAVAGPEIAGAFMLSSVGWLKSRGGSAEIAELASMEDGGGCPAITDDPHARHCPLRPANSSFTMAVAPQAHVILIAIIYHHW